jgi:hypothetical protein
MSIFSIDDAQKLRTDRLVMLTASLLPGFNPSDDYLLEQLLAAEARASQQLNVFLEPTRIFSTDPSQADIDGLNGAPYVVEPGYDYDPDFFQGERWGYIVCRQHPVQQVLGIQMAYPAPTNQVFAIPLDWIRLDHKYGHIRLVPASSAFVAPLGAFLLQALGAGQTIPSMIRVDYWAGLDKAGTKTPWSIDRYPNLITTIKYMACYAIVQDSWLPASASVSADGLSESLSVTLADYQDMIDRHLFGLKGSNGGLYTALNGIQSTILGVV